jgi:hypothetical protein
MQMANRKAYGYYLRGSQIALVEQDSILGAGQTLTPPALNDVGPDGDPLWKSPISDVADGIEIEYAYSPRYRITDITKVDLNITAYRSNGGYLEIGDRTSSYTNYGNLSGYNIADGSYIVLRNAGRWNGLHKTITKTSDNGTNDLIKLETRYNGGGTWSNFEEAVSLYYYIDTLSDEGDVIDLPEYLAKALVYYVKARLAEDEADPGKKDFFMKEYHRIVAKHDNSKIWGARMIASGPNAIR